MTAKVKQTITLKLYKINPISSLKISFLVSIGLAIANIVLFFLLWLFVIELGVFNAIAELFATDGDNGISNLKNIFPLSSMMSISFLMSIGLIIFISIFGLVFAWIYNAIAKITGGLSLKFYKDTGSQ